MKDFIAYFFIYLILLAIAAAFVVIPVILLFRYDNWWFMCGELILPSIIFAWLTKEEEGK